MMVVLGQFLTLLGALCMLIAAIGLVRMPDFFTRMHPAGIKDSLGMPLVMIGLMLQLGFTLECAKLLLLLVFVLLTSPVATHALARAALVIREKKASMKGTGHDA
ncbi:sodium:proton antiporter [bacterium]|nr:sodium:proton antiporter [bacterium]